MIQNQNIVLGAVFLIMLYFFWKGIQLFRGKDLERTLGQLGKNIEADHPINRQVGQSYIFQGIGIFTMGTSLLIDILTGLDIPSASAGASTGRPLLWIGFIIFILGMIGRGYSLRTAMKLPDPKKKKRSKNKKKRKK